MVVPGHITVLLHHVSSAAIELGPQFAIERRLNKFDDVRSLGRFIMAFGPVFSISGGVCNVHRAREIVGKRIARTHRALEIIGCSRRYRFSLYPQQIVVLNLDICDRPRVFQRLRQA